MLSATAFDITQVRVGTAARQHCGEQCIKWRLAIMTAQRLLKHRTFALRTALNETGHAAKTTSATASSASSATVGIPVSAVGMAAGNALIQADLLKVALHVINGQPFYGHDRQNALRHNY